MEYLLADIEAGHCYDSALHDCRALEFVVRWHPVLELAGAVPAPDVFIDARHIDRQDEDRSRRFELAAKFE